MAKAIIFYGPPASGKGTLASLLAKNFDFIHFDTGRYLEQLLYNPHCQKDKVIQKERKLFEKGTLNTPPWVLKIVSQATKKIARAGWSIVFSGSPRTILEAFGNQHQEGLFKLLSRLYGKENIFIFELKIKRETSIKRKSHRLICSVCGQPILFFLIGQRLKKCPFCAGPLKKRIVDDPKVIKERLIQYRKRTQPIIKKLKESGFDVIKINGEPAPYTIFQKIIPQIKND